jgi:hypothetical protein
VNFPNYPDQTTDCNKVYVSALNNPFYYDARNVYDLDGNVIGFGTNAVPISAGQFGQYPMFVFTDVGIYAMQIGTGEVIIESIVPLNGLICIDGKNIINLETNIIFKTDKDIMIMAGSEAKSISEVLNEYESGNPLNNNEVIIKNDTIISMLTNSRLGGFDASSIPSSVPIDVNTFIKILPTASLGYDTNLHELWVSPAPTEIGLVNQANYSYVFDVNTGVWSKRSIKFQNFISDYPKLYGIQKSGTTYPMYNMSNETAVAYKSVYFQSRPLKFAEGFNKIRRLIMRGYVKTSATDATGNLFGIYLFASLDGTKWALIDGKEVWGAVNDCVALASQFSAKYFIIAMSGQIDPYSYLTHFDVEATHALGQSIR